VKTSGDAHEPLDLTTSRSTESTVTADSVQLESTALPSPSVTDPDSKPVAAAVKAPEPAVACRRSARQRRRTAKAAGEDGCSSIDEVVTPRKHRASGRPAYICQLCDKEFTKHSSLVRHTYQHSGETLHISVTSFRRTLCDWEYFYPVQLPPVSSNLFPSQFPLPVPGLVTFSFPCWCPWFFQSPPVAISIYGSISKQQRKDASSSVELAMLKHAHWHAIYH